MLVRNSISSINMSHVPQNFYISSIEVLHKFAKLRNSAIMEENVRFCSCDSLYNSNVFFHNGGKLRNLAFVKDLYTRSSMCFDVCDMIPIYYDLILKLNVVIVFFPSKNG